jgi:hypothetical protein
MTRQQYYLKVLLLMTSFALGINAQDYDALQLDLNQNMTLWNDLGIADYDYVIRISCFCLFEEGAVSIQVRNNTIEDSQLFGYPTVMELFDSIQSAITDEADAIIVTYDSMHGYPNSIYTDWYEGGFDDEITYEILELEPIGSTTPVRVSPAPSEAPSEVPPPSQEQDNAQNPPTDEPTPAFTEAPTSGAPTKEPAGGPTRQAPGKEQPTGEDSTQEKESGAYRTMCLSWAWLFAPALIVL